MQACQKRLPFLANGERCDGASHTVFSLDVAFRRVSYENYKEWDFLKRRSLQTNAKQIKSKSKSKSKAKQSKAKQSDHNILFFFSLDVAFRRVSYVNYKECDFLKRRSLQAKAKAKRSDHNILFFFSLDVAFRRVSYVNYKECDFLKRRSLQAKAKRSEAKRP